jgi:altronate dehydratase large subunit
MDIDLSKMLQGKETVTEAGNRILEEVISVASGKMKRAERQAQRDFCTFKTNINI